MQEEINLLKQQIADNKRDFDDFKNMMSQQIHNGVDGGLVDFNNLSGLIRTVNVAADLTAILAGKPTIISEQIIIDVTTGTHKLYVYESMGTAIPPVGAWKSVTIA